MDTVRWQGLEVGEHALDELSKAVVLVAGQRMRDAHTNLPVNPHLLRLLSISVCDVDVGFAKRNYAKISSTAGICSRDDVSLPFFLRIGLGPEGFPSSAISNSW